MAWLSQIRASERTGIALPIDATLDAGPIGFRCTAPPRRVAYHLCGTPAAPNAEITTLPAALLCRRHCGVWCRPDCVPFAEPGKYQPDRWAVIWYLTISVMETCVSSALRENCPSLSRCLACQMLWQPQAEWPCVGYNCLCERAAWVVGRRHRARVSMNVSIE